MEIPIKWSFNYFFSISAWKAAILCVSAFVGVHQNKFDSGRQNEKKLKNSKYLMSDVINTSIFSLWKAGRQTVKVKK